MIHIRFPYQMAPVEGLRRGSHTIPLSSGTRGVSKAVFTYYFLTKRAQGRSKTWFTYYFVTKWDPEEGLRDGFKYYFLTSWYPRGI